MEESHHLLLDDHPTHGRSQARGGVHNAEGLPSPQQPAASHGLSEGTGLRDGAAYNSHSSKSGVHHEDRLQTFHSSVLVIVTVIKCFKIHFRLPTLKSTTPKRPRPPTATERSISSTKN